MNFLGVSKNIDLQDAVSALGIEIDKLYLSAQNMETTMFKLDEKNDPAIIEALSKELSTMYNIVMDYVYSTSNTYEKLLDIMKFDNGSDKEDME